MYRLLGNRRSILLGTLPSSFASKPQLYVISFPVKATLPLLTLFHPGKENNSGKVGGS